MIANVRCSVLVLAKINPIGFEDDEMNTLKSSWLTPGVYWGNGCCMKINIKI